MTVTVVVPRPTVVHVVLPNDIDDPASPSGGNRYDRRVCDGLAASGWSVREHPAAGEWPTPDGRSRAALARTLAGLPDNALVLFDALVSSAVPEVVGARAGRLRQVALVHMPLGTEAERAALSAMAAVVTTSDWSRRRLIGDGLPPARVTVAVPGVDPAPLVPSADEPVDAGGARLLCVAALAQHKGQDVLVDALARLADRPWRCRLVGSWTREPAFVARLRAAVAEAGLAQRVDIVGPRTGAELAAVYAATNLLLLPSRREAYGMVVTEALARGIPAVVSTVGGLPEALGATADGRRPGLLVAPDDPAGLADALGRWLDDQGLRRALTDAARERRATLSGWSVTTGVIAGVLERVTSLAGAR